MFGFGRKNREEHKVITLGYDVKITPEGKPFIIEINGKYSGVKGLEKISGENVNRIRSEIRSKIVIKGDLNVRKDTFGKKWENLEYFPKIVSLIDGAKDGVSLTRRQENFLAKDQIEQGDFVHGVYDEFFSWASRCWSKEFLGYLKGVDMSSSAEVMEELLGNLCFIDDEELGAIFFGKDQDEIQTKWVKSFVKYYFRKQKSIPSKVIILDTELINKTWFNPVHYLMGMHDIIQLNDKPPYLKVHLQLDTNGNQFEEVCENKLEQKKWIPKDFQVFYQQVECPFDPRDFLRMMEVSTDKFSSDKVVVKKIRGGNCGNEVKIINTEAPGNRAIFKSELWSGYEGEPILMEGFVPSKKIYCDETGDYHDGCMRYLIDFHVRKSGGKLIYEPIYEAGYWRLAPVGLNGERIFHAEEQEMDLENWKYKANLANGAIPARTMDNDLAKARQAVMSSVELIMADPEVF